VGNQHPLVNGDNYDAYKRSELLHWVRDGAVRLTTSDRMSWWGIPRGKPTVFVSGPAITREAAIRDTKRLTDRQLPKALLSPQTESVRS